MIVSYRYYYYYFHNCLKYAFGYLSKQIQNKEMNKMQSFACENNK